MPVGFVAHSAPRHPGRTIAIIPARYESSRFPGKPLAEIAGRPMIEHVYRRASASRSVDAVIVATDDERIVAAVERFGTESVMTGPDHPNGTGRRAEGEKGLGLVGAALYAFEQAAG